MLKLCSLILICFLSVACGKKNSAGGSSKKFTLSQKISSIIADQRMDCPQGSCPAAIARLFVLDPSDPNNLSNCTGSLVGERLLLTNSHCIEGGSLEQVCRGFYAVFKKGDHYKTARCHQILFRHQHQSANASDLSHNDYALIELDRDHGITPLEIDPAGFSRGQRVHPYVIDHRELTESRTVRLSCSVTDRSLPSSRGRDNVLLNCPAIPGNSGAPILSSEGKLVGVLYAGGESVVDEYTDLAARVTVGTFAAGFSTPKILEDLGSWL